MAAPSFPVDLDHLRKYGYVVVDGLVSGERLERLRAAGEAMVERARSLTWRDVRVVGKQFPPWSTDDMSDVWGVQRLLDPANPDAAAFLEWYTSPELVSVVSQILGTPVEDLQIELFNMLINPARTPFALNWHRDSIAPDVDVATELEQLKQQSGGTQWNTALYDDSCLIVVPASHNRARTEEERRTNLETPKASLPGELVVRLRAGQTVFYHNNILHRGAYSTEPKRLTLHASMGHGSARANNLIQHNIAFLASPEFRALCDTLQRPYVERMRENIAPLVKGRDPASAGYVLKA